MLNIVFAATGGVVGVIGAGLVLLWPDTGRGAVGVGTGASGRSITGGSVLPPPPTETAPPAQQVLNEYQLYLLVTEYLSRLPEGLLPAAAAPAPTSPGSLNGTDPITRFEFYRLVFKLIRAFEKPGP